MVKRTVREISVLSLLCYVCHAIIEMFESMNWGIKNEQLH